MQTTKEDLISVTNPSNGEILSEIKPSSDSEIKEKIQKAKIAFPLWSSLTVKKGSLIYKKSMNSLLKTGRI